MQLASTLQYLISGLTVGSTYGLIALGFTIIFNTTGIINFAQGEFVMLGAIFSLALLKAAHMPLALAVLLAVVCATLVGGIIQLGTIRPVKNGSVIQLIIITIGVSIVIRGLVLIFWGTKASALPYFTGNTPIDIFGAKMLPQHIWILAITLVLLIALKLFFTKTLFGRGMLACSYDSKAASLVGIDVERMVLVSFMISAFVGAVGGVILAPITMTSYTTGILLGLKGFAACILGGLGNPFGAAAGGIILGVLENFGAGFISSAYKDAIAFIILLLLLFVKPSGLFGRSSAERV